jgi:hypothetical protein
MAFFEKRYHPPGTAPGTLTEVPATEAEPLLIRLINYCAVVSPSCRCSTVSKARFCF